MNLPPDFVFSQSSLQALAECPQRFYLRYGRGLAWPAPAAAVDPARAVNGARFHLAVQQYLLGVPAAAVAASLDNPDLRRWWAVFLEAAPTAAGGRRWAEAELRAPLGAFQVLAKYDLLLQQPEGRLTIFDWKTARQKPGRAALAGRWQTRLYPYVLARAGGAWLEDQPPHPAQIEMMYWFVEQPAAPERFQYAMDDFQRTGRELTAVLATVAALDPEQDLRTPVRERCRFCPYQTYCDRAPETPATAPEMDDTDDELSADADSETS